MHFARTIGTHIFYNDSWVCDSSLMTVHTRFGSRLQTQHVDIFHTRKQLQIEIMVM